MVDSAKEPTAGEDELEIVEAFPCGLGAWTIKGPEENTCDDLYQEREDNHGGQQPGICAAVGNRPVANFVGECWNCGAVIEPYQESVKHAGKGENNNELRWFILIEGGWSYKAGYLFIVASFPLFLFSSLPHVPPLAVLLKMGSMLCSLGA